MSNNFQEQFPSLDNKTYCRFGDDIEYDANSGDLLFISDVQKHCLDKKRVKEAIEKCCTIDESGVGMIYPIELIKELGLDK